MTLRAAGGEALRLGGRGIALEYVRGFAGRLELPARAFFAQAAGLFRCQPITAVRLAGKEPAKVRGGWWWADACLDPADPAVQARFVPPQLYSWLVRGPAIGRRRGRALTPAELTFPSPQAAQAALSSACVAFGRAQAGLRRNG